MDATIVSAPVSSRNRSGQRDPEMQYFLAGQLVFLLIGFMLWYFARNAT